MWRAFLGSILACALAWPGTAEVAAAAPVARSFRVGWLGNGSSSDSQRGVEDFLQGLRDVGYVPGQNLFVDSRFADGSIERLADLASELVRLSVDVIVTSGQPAALAARRATNAIPIVVTEITMDPVRSGLVASLGRPGGNVTGIAAMGEDLWPKRLGILKVVVPRLGRVAALWNPSNPGNVECINEVRSAGPALGLQLHAIDVSDASGVKRALTQIPKASIDALIVCWDAVTLANARAIGEFGATRQVPTLAPLKEYVRAGSLMSLGMDLSSHRRRAAYYVDKILKGAKPADLPVEQTTNPEFAVNLSTAHAIAVDVPGTLLGIADEIVRE
jgi:putative ABC transport system substrate-binding protein